MSLGIGSQVGWGIDVVMIELVKGREKKENRDLYISLRIERLSVFIAWNDMDHPFIMRTPSDLDS
jgi:hypothetical protein